MAIRRFRHAGLETFFRTGRTSGIRPDHANRLRWILGLLDSAASPHAMGLPGLRLHPLKGPRLGTWSVRVSANWRVTFCFDGVHATDVDYEDYH
jgi:toxin HigB-1